MSARINIINNTLNTIRRADPHASCMENNNCKKNFSKILRETTAYDVNENQHYRRHASVTTVVRGVPVNNSSVVPYNPYFIFKYDAHINMKVSTTLRAVKNIYKYINKDFDCANFIISYNKISLW